MQLLVTNLNDYQHLKNNEFVARESILDASHLIQDVIQTYSLDAKQSEIDLVYITPLNEAPEVVLSDSDRVS